MYCLPYNLCLRMKLWAGTKYLFQDLHSKYFPHLSTLNLPHLENLKTDILFWYDRHYVKVI